MPFRLTNISTSEQELINNIFKDILDEYIITYLNNILVYSNRVLDDYIKKVHKIFRWFNKRNLRFKPKKIPFLLKKIEFLGYIVNKNKVYINLQKIISIKEWL